MLAEALKIKFSETSYRNDIFGSKVLSSSNSSYLTAPLICKESDTGTDTSAKRAVASLLALDSRPPPKKRRSAGLVRFP